MTEEGERFRLRAEEYRRKAEEAQDEPLERLLRDLADPCKEADHEEGDPSGEPGGNEMFESVGADRFNP